MGQIYSVYMNYKVKDEELLVKLTNEYIKNEKFSEKCFDNSNLTTAEGCIRAFLAVDTQPESFEIRPRSKGFNEYYNCFKATYSWEDVLWCWFKNISQALEDESDLDVDTDDSVWRLKVIDGVGKEARNEII